TSLLSAAAVVALSLPVAGLITAAPAHAQEATVECRMDFRLAGWAIIYKEASGSGTVTCSNGQSANVDISAKGGGLAAGKYEIDDGVGTFSKVKDISEI